MPKPIAVYTGDKSKVGKGYIEDGQKYVWVYDESADTHRAPCKGKLSMLGRTIGHAGRCPETEGECEGDKDCLNAYKVGQMRVKKKQKLDAKFEKKMVPKIKKHMKATRDHDRDSYGKCTMQCKKLIKSKSKKKQQQLFEKHDVPNKEQYCANKCHNANQYQLKL